MLALLKEEMGTYEKNGTTKHRFNIKYNKKVTGVSTVRAEKDSILITCLSFADGSKTKEKKNVDKVSYVWAHGESVGAMEALALEDTNLSNFIEPAHAGFAGASLSLTIDIPAGREKEFADFNHYMEVDDEDTVLAWQGRTIEGNKIFLLAQAPKHSTAM